MRCHTARMLGRKDAGGVRHWECCITKGACGRKYDAHGNITARAQKCVIAPVDTAGWRLGSM